MGGTGRFWGTWAKNFASALVAGGAGTVLTLVLTGNAVGAETWWSLVGEGLFAALVGGALRFTATEILASIPRESGAT